MSISPSVTTRNLLLRRLSSADHAELAPFLKTVELPLWKQLGVPNKPIEHVFFPESGATSVLAHGIRRREIEVGFIGREGMTASVVVMGGDRSPNLTIVQAAGRAQRIHVDDLRAITEAHPAIRQLFLCYAQALMVQSEQTSVANATGSIETRLVRWLLMMRDRADSDQLELVHESLARMLGVHRPGVTVAIHALEGRRFVKATRGRITILNREEMMEFAGPLYGVPEAEYARLLSNDRKATTQTDGRDAAELEATALRLG